jgi:hypothetical protein
MSSSCVAEISQRERERERERENRENIDMAASGEIVKHFYAAVRKGSNAGSRLLGRVFTDRFSYYGA